jgi:uncharacterized protein YceK
MTIGTSAATRGWVAALAAMLMLGGCSSLITETSSAGAGVAGAEVASTITSNAAVAAGIGLGVQAVVRAGVQYTERQVHHAEQVQIASAAGPLAPGSVGTWRVNHDIPIENDEHGAVAVSRVIVANDAAGLDCKEIVFSVDTVVKQTPLRAFYTAAICRDGALWRWATAEPATARWGSLQ